MKMSVAKEKKKDVGETWKTDDPDDCEKEINSLLEDKIETDAILKHPHLDIRLVNSVNTFIQKKKKELGFQMVLIFPEMVTYLAI